MQRACRQCQTAFEVTDDDLAFYEKVSPVFAGEKQLIPPPTLCPDCRQQRRLAWRNERNLYARTCDLCMKHIVSVYPAGMAFPVYCLTCWWGDRWSAEEYGQEYDPKKPLLVQWEELHRRVPKLAIQNDNGIESENCEYCYDISRSKDCYRLIGSWFDQDCHYSLNINHARSVVDCNSVSLQTELAYESLDSQRLYHCAYLQSCQNCHDCFVGFDLKGCADCIACYGLRQKRFCIFNEQCSESEYRSKAAAWDFGSLAAVKKLRADFDAWILRFPRLYANLQNCEDCAGNNLFNCRKTLGWSIFNAEFCKFVDRSDSPLHSYDIINTGGAQWCCDCVTPDKSYMALFSVWCWQCKNVLFSDNCHSSEHLLGCISMHRNKYCILNKKYSKEEYETIAVAVIDSLRRESAWGELLPVRLSPFGYNESGAREYFPLAKDEVLRRGWKWCDDLPYTTGKETIGWDRVPDRIQDAPHTMEQEIFACQTCGKNFKMIPAEISFYRAMPVPLPRNCPECRHLIRFKRKTPTKIWARTCTKCAKNIQTTYAPERPERVFCEECYLKEVY